MAVVHGASAPLVADVLGVAELERRAGAPRRPGSMLTKRGIVERFRAGRSPVQIAAEADLSVGRVETILRDRGVLAPPPAGRAREAKRGRPAAPPRGDEPAGQTGAVVPGEGRAATVAGSGSVVAAVRRAADQAETAGAPDSPFACRGRADATAAVHIVIASCSASEKSPAVDLLLDLDALHRDAITHRDTAPSRHLTVLYAARASVVESVIRAADQAIQPA